MSDAASPGTSTGTSPGTDPGTSPETGSTGGAGAAAADGAVSRTEQTKRLVRRFFDACNRRDFATIFDCFHPDIVHYSRLSEYPKEGIAFAYEATFSAFPDLRWTIADIIAEDDKVATLVSIEGTHLGEYLGKSATGRRVRIWSVDIGRVADGRFIEHRGVLDELHLLAQIGVVPETYLAQMS